MPCTAASDVAVSSSFEVSLAVSASAPSPSLKRICRKDALFRDWEISNRVRVRLELSISSRSNSRRTYACPRHPKEHSPPHLQMTKDEKKERARLLEENYEDYMGDRDTCI